MTKEEIRALRLDKGLTLTEMGALLGVSMRSICNWEAGIYEVPKPIAKLVRLLLGGPNDKVDDSRGMCP